MSLSGLTVNVHPGSAPTIELGDHTGTKWMTIRDENGAELMAIFLNDALILELRRVLAELDGCVVKESKSA